MLIKPVRFSRATLAAELLISALVLCMLGAAFRLYYPGLGTSRTFSESGTVGSGAVFRPPSQIQISDAEAGLIELTAEHFNNFPLQKPYKDKFGELGGRLRVLKEWIELAAYAAPGPQQERLLNAAEAVVASAFPFLRKNQTSHTPLADLRARFTSPRGIVIPTGSKTFRFACHLIISLRRVFKTTLPIQIVYAGDSDLPKAYRDAIASLFDEDESGEIEFLDALQVFDDKTLRLTSGQWAIKAFAALACKFEEVILLDADAVFLQDPVVLLKQEAYLENGALFFHDRLLWQNKFRERHQWWHSQVIHAGPELKKSLVWTKKYAEEQDSGVVVFDKSRLDVLMGLLHVAWQNTYAVRKEVTYKLTYGDKEAWWFGLELAGATYAFEKHYGGIVGWPQNTTDALSSSPPYRQKVCSFVIAHVDEDDRLLWYNGGLLKNKMTQRDKFEVPTHWMIDAEWEKGARKIDMSCMKHGPVLDLTEQEKQILERSIEEAQGLDRYLRSSH